jgi:hypothetical protein
MDILKTGLFSSKDTSTMNGIELTRWERLSQILPGVRPDDRRPDHLLDANWDCALVMTALNDCSEGEIYTYFEALRHYYPLGQFKALLERIEKFLPAPGKQGKYLSLVQGALSRIVYPM